MTSGQRKVHKKVWLGISVVIPVLMFFALKNVTILASEEKETPHIEISKRIPLKIVKNEKMKAILFDESIDIILHEPLKNASSVVYAMDENENKTTLLGQISTSGIYSFTTNRFLKGILVYDAIKGVEISKLKF